MRGRSLARSSRGAASPGLARSPHAPSAHQSPQPQKCGYPAHVTLLHGLADGHIRAPREATGRRRGGGPTSRVRARHYAADDGDVARRHCAADPVHRRVTSPSRMIPRTPFPATLRFLPIVRRRLLDLLPRYLTPPPSAVTLSRGTLQLASRRGSRARGSTGLSAESR